MISIIDATLRLGAAVIAGGLIGINRDLHGKPAGVRLNALVAVGSALFVMVGVDLAPDSGQAVSRVIQGITGGIGFLGAGIIIRNVPGGRVQNLNTAATIWVTASLGTACGVGAWLYVGLATAAVLVILTLGLALDRSFF